MGGSLSRWDKIGKAHGRSSVHVRSEVLAKAVGLYKLPTVFIIKVIETSQTIYYNGEFDPGSG